jgi:hypothetical protein
MDAVNILKLERDYLSSNIKVYITNRKMKLLKTFSLNFITNKSPAGNVLEIRNSEDFLNQNPKCSDCFLNKGCICKMYEMIQQNTGMPHISKIVGFLYDLGGRRFTIEIYISRVVNIQVHNLPFTKLRKMGIERYISFENSCKHLKYIGTNNKLPYCNLYFG